MTILMTETLLEECIRKLQFLIINLNYEDLHMLWYADELEKIVDELLLIR